MINEIKHLQKIGASGAQFQCLLGLNHSSSGSAFAGVHGARH